MHFYREGFLQSVDGYLNKFSTLLLISCCDLEQSGGCRRKNGKIAKDISTWIQLILCKSVTRI